MMMRYSPWALATLESAELLGTMLLALVALSSDVGLGSPATLPTSGARRSCLEASATGLDKVLPERAFPLGAIAAEGLTAKAAGLVPGSRRYSADTAYSVCKKAPTDSCHKLVLRALTHRIPKEARLVAQVCVPLLERVDVWAAVQTRI